MRLQRWLLVALLSLLVPVVPLSAQEQPLDLLIRGGQVIDGTGNPWFSADVGIRGGKIVAVGQLAGATAARTIDARGKIVTPGFIDIHFHASASLESEEEWRRAAPNVVTQGVTTVSSTPTAEGRSQLPISRQRWSA